MHFWMDWTCEKVSRDDDVAREVLRVQHYIAWIYLYTIRNEQPTCSFSAVVCSVHNVVAVTVTFRGVTASRMRAKDRVMMSLAFASHDDVGYLDYYVVQCIVVYYSTSLVAAALSVMHCVYV
jgi:hypothetical protein